MEGLGIAFVVLVVVFVLMLRRSRTQAAAPAVDASVTANNWGQRYLDKQHAGVKTKAIGQLAVATRTWTAPLVMRHYQAGKVGDALFQAEAEVLLEHGYDFETQSEEGGHIHAGRILLTGGLSLFAGGAGTRAKGKISVTYRRTTEAALAGGRGDPGGLAVTTEPHAAAAPATPDPMSALDALAKMRDAGHITAEEYEAKKAELLARL